MTSCDQERQAKKASEEVRLRVALVNMPFASWNRPSFALSQLSALINEEFGDAVDVRVHYLNQDMATYFGRDTYESIARSVDHLLTGIGDWMFRHIAFPAEDDNSGPYFKRYYRGPDWVTFKRHMEERRTGLRHFCEELIKIRGLAGADLVGFTSMFAQTVPSIALATLLKQINPGVITCMGGANCEAPMGRVIAERVSAIDYVFSGPALCSFPEVLRCILSGRTDKVSLVPGVLTRRNYVRSPRQEVGAERDINEFSVPDYSDFVAQFNESSQLADPQEQKEPVLYFETSRGCWWGQRSHCTFCGLNGANMDYRAMSPDKARLQFRQLFTFAPWCKQFDCTDNILPKSYFGEVLDKLDPPAGASLFYEIKIPLSEREFRALATGGVTRVQPGIEAMSTKTLRLMGKGTTAFQNIKFLKSCLRYGIKPEWNLLIGFPGETEDIYQKYLADLPLLTHLPPPTGVFMVRFDRYSIYHAESQRFGLRLRPVDSYQLIYPFCDQDLAQLAYFFTDDGGEPYAALAAEWHQPLTDLVARWKRRWEAPGSAAGTPQLALSRTLTGTAELIDTRSDQVLRTPIDSTMQTLLRSLVSPSGPSKLAEQTRLTEEQVDALLASLSAHGLVFEEDGRYMSLVASADSPDGDEI